MTERRLWFELMERAKITTERGGLWKYWTTTILHASYGIFEQISQSLFVGAKKEKGCSKLRNALVDLKPVMKALYEFHDNLHLQRKSFIEEKKMKIAALKKAKKELLAGCKFCYIQKVLLHFCLSSLFLS